MHTRRLPTGKGTLLPDKLDRVVSTIASSSPENPRNDTATLLELSPGRLLCAYHAFKPSPFGAGDYGYAEGVLRESRDGGRTWGDPRVIVVPDPGDQNVHGVALGRAADGSLLLSALVCHTPSSGTMRLYRSRDDGNTFERLNDIWHTERAQWIQGGAAGLYTLRDGRLIIPFCGGGEGLIRLMKWHYTPSWITPDKLDEYRTTQEGQHYAIGMAWSDDQGSTWTVRHPLIDLPMRGAIEPSLVECKNGELTLSIRTQLGAVMFSHSSDRGESWSHPQPGGLGAPENCTCLRRLPGGNRLALFWTDGAYDVNDHHYGARTPLSLALSDDNGRHWTKAADLAAEPDVAYTNLNCTFLSDGAALLTFAYRKPAWKAHGGEHSLRMMRITGLV